MGCCGSCRKKVHPQLPVLYLWPGSAPCRAVLMTIRATKLKVDKKIINILKDEQKSNGFTKINPDHTVPTLIDSTVKPEVKLWESHAVARHLVDAHTPDHAVYPAEVEVRAQINRFLDMNKERIYPVITEWVYPQIFQHCDPNPDKERLVHEVLKELNATLEERPYLAASHVTLADFCVMASLSLLELVTYDFLSWEKLCLWRNKLKMLPYYPECNIGLEDWKFAIQLQKQEK